MSRSSRIEIVNGLAFRLTSSDAQEADADTFVLVHGIGVSHRYFSRLHSALEKTSTVHSVDLPGFGGLPAPRVPLGVADMSAALATLLERFGVAGAVLVGHSMGAQWVVELALQRPALASHVVLIGPVSDDRHRTARAQFFALAADTLREPIDANVLVFSDYLRCPPRWYFAQLREMLDYPLEERVRAVEAPLLIVRGGRDPIAGQAWARRLRDSAAPASLVAIPGHPHVVQHTAPWAVTSAMRAFVDGSRAR